MKFHVNFAELTVPDYKYFTIPYIEMMKNNCRYNLKYVPPPS